MKIGVTAWRIHRFGPEEDAGELAAVSALLIIVVLILGWLAWSTPWRAATVALALVCLIPLAITASRGQRLDITSAVGNSVAGALLVAACVMASRARQTEHT